jgi:predicted DNA-binding transcriptional regulator AlpA
MAQLKATKARVLLPGDRFLTATEAATILGTTRNTLGFYRSTRIGPRFYKMGRSVRYLLSEITAYGTRNAIETRDAC